MRIHTNALIGLGVPATGSIPFESMQTLLIVCSA